MKYGLLDTKDNVWMGTDTGPILYDEEILAQAAAQMVDVQLRQALGRTRARPYDGTATRIKDEKKVTMSPREALKRIEEGHV